MLQSKLKLESSNYLMEVVEEYIIICSEKSLIKVNKDTGEIIQFKKVFSQNKRSRQLLVDGKFIYLREFCTIYKIDIDSFTILEEWKLGTDLSSDICGINFDDENIYAGMRNGPLAVINKESEEVKYYNVSSSSIWTLKVNDYIYAGNVNGELLKIDKTGFKVLRCENIHKKNLKSMIAMENTIYTASQDLSLAMIEKANLNIIARCKQCHKKMFYILDIWKDFIITVSPPCKETKFWNLSDLSLYRKIDKASWSMVIDKDTVYMMDGKGIHFAEIEKLLD